MGPKTARPAAEDAELAAEEPPPPPAEARDLVLVIDDDANARDLIRRHLEREAFAVIQAPNGPDGVRLAREAGPVAITPMADDFSKGYALGAADYLTKPIEPSRLLATLDRYGGSRSGQILLVEDEPITRLMFRDVLVRAGWEVLEAEDGRAALAQLEATTPKMIIMDLAMPVMDGFELAEVLRQREEWRAIPVAVITGRSLSDEERERLDGFVQAVVDKSPVDAQQLLKQIGYLVKEMAPPGE